MGEDDDYLSDDDCTCPRCSGWGHIDCHCGGDLCVCDNYGEADCPLCCGDGQISTARYDAYQAAQRKWWAEYQAVMTRRERRAQPRPKTTPKRAKTKAARKQRKRTK